MYHLSRVSLALANLTGDKVAGGVARLLGKGGVSKVAGKPTQAEADIDELIRGEAMQTAKRLGGVDAAPGPLGQMFVRAGLRLTGEEKLALAGHDG